MIGSCAGESLPRVVLFGIRGTLESIPWVFSGGALVGVPQKDSWSSETGWFSRSLDLVQSHFAKQGSWASTVSETTRHPDERTIIRLMAKTKLTWRIGSGIMIRSRGGGAGNQ